MKLGYRPLIRLTRLLALAAGLLLATTGLAQSNDYGKIGQLLRAGKLDEARAQVDRLLTSRPRDPQLRYYRGLIQRESGQLPEAMATFTKLTEDHPELPEPYNGLAVIHAAQGDFEQARAALEKAIRANPGYATAHENLADLYVRLACRAYGKAQQLDANNAALQAKLAAVRASCQP